MPWFAMNIKEIVCFRISGGVAHVGIALSSRPAFSFSTPQGYTMQTQDAYRRTRLCISNLPSHALVSSSSLLFDEVIHAHLGVVLFLALLSG